MFALEAPLAYDHTDFTRVIMRLLCFVLVILFFLVGSTATAVNLENGKYTDWVNASASEKLQFAQSQVSAQKAKYPTANIPSPEQLVDCINRRYERMGKKSQEDSIESVSTACLVGMNLGTQFPHFLTY